MSVNIKTALINLAQQKKGIILEVVELIISQQLQGIIEKENVDYLCKQHQLSPVQLALACLPIAACYASPPVSKFYVGAIAIGESGTFYFGGNQEFAHDAIQQTVHAEQSAIAHAWLSGEKKLTDIVVNYTPCGHCRQFMNELNSAAQLKIHLPHSQHNLLHGYLPDAFGPKDLNIEKVLFDSQHHYFILRGDELTQAAISAANQSYAPYSQAFSGIALQVGERIITGQYAENAAFNPSFLPLQSALNFRRLRGLDEIEVSRIVFAEKDALLSHKTITEALAKSFFNLSVEYINI
ncbi:cytidine deaminase [Glaesserella sp.]|uniref:cytidine deaminase n=1 Tax=Glaesserella sp. TaxID=2094731 RepID=UPI0035A0564F